MNTECIVRRRAKLHTYFGLREFGLIDTMKLESKAREERGAQARTGTVRATAVPMITNGSRILTLMFLPIAGYYQAYSSTLGAISYE